MFWADKLIETLNKDQLHIINDSKTPSGRAHVGALRGVLIHDVMFRRMKEEGFNVRYTFGVDDFDPLDEIPYGKDEHYRQYLGMPLCNVPPPPGSDATDMSDYYISEFFGVFKYLGVEAETYRLRDIYRAGEFDEPIDVILHHADIVRKVYKEVSGSDRPASWYPFQVICENCQKLGTTEVVDYDGKEVTYHCRPNMVKWATGCGHYGKMSPFSGNGKLPWKLEWVAKWATRGVTVEGAGKDHTTKGGSRDVSASCLKAIFNKPSPLNIPYEFFLVEGAKMSSSRGIGVAAGDMADFLPPEILRFLMLRSQPNRPINFSPDEKAIVKLFNDFDRYKESAFQTESTDEVKEVYRLSEVRPEPNYFVPDIQLLQALVQMPHINVIGEIGKRSQRQLTELDMRHIERRMASIKYWLDRYATDDEKLELKTELPEIAKTLSATQIAFLHRLAEKLKTANWQADKLQKLIFDVIRITPIKQPDAFQAIYKTLFAREAGPKIGNLFEFLEPDFLIARFNELSYSKVEFWRETGEDYEGVKAWLIENKAVIDSPVFAHIDFAITTHLREYRVDVIEFEYRNLADNKTYLKRAVFEFEEGDDFQAEAQKIIKELAEKTGLKINSTPSPTQDVF
jgi:lysyl-tRNA synthetase, class I